MDLVCNWFRAVSSEAVDPSPITLDPMGRGAPKTDTFSSGCDLNFQKTAIKEGQKVTIFSYHLFRGLTVSKDSLPLTYHLAYNAGAGRKQGCSNGFRRLPHKVPC